MFKHTLVYLLLAAPGFASTLHAQTLLRPPYLQMGTPGSMTVVWRTTTPADGVVRYGRSPTQLDQTITATETTPQHAVTIAGLQPSTTYWYTVGSSSTVLADGESYH